MRTNRYGEVVIDCYEVCAVLDLKKPHCGSCHDDFESGHSDLCGPTEIVPGLVFAHCCDFNGDSPFTGETGFRFTEEQKQRMREYLESRKKGASAPKANEG